jgi:16S rRNA (adenine1518-N6/adenine1519-N6)-dimethyltransferase
MAAKIIPNKSLGQHWLRDRDCLQAMAVAADISKDDEILEVGPGLGYLTEILIKNSKHLTLVELDRVLASRLEKSFNTPKVDIFNQDILKFNLNELDRGYKLVANIPYYLTSNLIRIISESNNPPKRAVILIQKEVAERLAAHPGQMSILSVTTQFYWEVTLKEVVNARLFTPPPKVDSQIVMLERRLKPLYGDVKPAEYFRVVKAGFSNKRKTIQNSLSAGLRIDQKVLSAHLTQAGVDPKRRAQTLTLEEWHQLALALT